jgi:RNA polymerase sigma-70 factor, ECF subfamily
MKVFANNTHTNEPRNLTVHDLRLLDDESVMAHIQAGNGDALAVLFDRYQRLVYNIALNIVRNVEDAEDVVQNVFLEIYRVAWQFDSGRGTARTWILQFAYHRSMDRRQQLQRYYNSFIEVDLQQLFVSSPNDTARSYDNRCQLEDALELLKPMQRRVLELACLEGLSFKEIADLVGETTGNVRHHYYRSLCKLRTFIITAKGPRQECFNEGTNVCMRARAGVLP